MYGHEPVRRKPVDPNAHIYHPPPPQQQQQHTRTRTTSSSIFPGPQYQQHPGQAPMHLQQPQLPVGHTRRSPSVNTFSTVSSNPPPAAFRTSPTSDIRRSTSSRSGGAPATSYVALMRKQKATVWSERSQPEDPRAAAQKKAAKEKASREVALGRGGRTQTGLSAPSRVAGKIRHVKPGPDQLQPNSYGVSGVPMRLSATEVEGEDSDEDDTSMRRLHHRRTGSSGRSSIASAGRRQVVSGSYNRSSGVPSIYGGAKRWSPGDTPERTGSMVEQPVRADDKGPVVTRTQSNMSGSSGEKADALPDMAPSNAAKLATNSLLNATLTREKSVKNPEELRRRGSVDERTATMTTQRLFIANPD